MIENYDGPAIDWSVYGLENNEHPVEYGDPDYCDACGHFHNVQFGQECPDGNRSCGSYLCCRPSDDDGPTVINIYGANYGAINM